ncbi:MAG: bifunctional UDP-N-acetylglucosamine diphosphorylase/glucosamine-1-phosphate N-acetyltransferase GlmU [Bacillota bacterium]
MSDLLTVILAAGKGTRMKSDLTKVLHPIAGKEMVKHVIETIDELSSKIVAVIGHQGEKVQQSLSDYSLDFVEQKEQLGTAHAVMQAKKQIKAHDGPVLVLYGDTPLLKKTTIENLINSHQENNAGLSILTAKLDNPESYGRIIRDAKGEVNKIVEEDDASDNEKRVKEINSGVYCFESDLLAESLDNIDTNNAQNEYYLTDAVDYIKNNGNKVIPVPIKNTKEIIGVNDRSNLAKAEKVLRKRINEKLMASGVTIIDPSTTYIDKEVVIKKDTVIYPFTYIEKSTVIESGSVIGPHSRLVNAKLGKNVELKANSQVWESEIGNNCTIGPFAYIRPGSKIADEVKVGDFVELKKAQIGENTKVPHLSYVGDASIGEKTNIGAGTIFANYDGKKKHKTEVGDSVFIGSNSTLVAPVKIANNAKTGAGSVVTKDVKKGTVVLGVPAHIHKKGEKAQDD